MEHLSRKSKLTTSVLPYSAKQENVSNAHYVHNDSGFHSLQYHSLYALILLTSTLIRKKIYFLMNSFSKARVQQKQKRSRTLHHVEPPLGTSASLCVLDCVCLYKHSLINNAAHPLPILLRDVCQMPNNI